jgi:hypothetical protein
MVEPGFDGGSNQARRSTARRRFLHHVDDHVAAFVLRAFELQAQLLAHRAAAAVAGHHPVGLHGVRSVRRFDVHLRAPLRAAPCHLAGPAHVDQAALGQRRLVRELLGVELLDVDHGREALRRLAGHLEMQHFRSRK